MDTTNPARPPFYIRGAYLLLFVALVLAFLYLGKRLGVLIVASLLFSFLALPFCKKLESWQAPRSMAAGISVIALMTIIVGLVCFISYEIMSFMADFPTLKASIQEKVRVINSYVESNYSISRREQTLWVQEKTSDWLNSGASTLLAFFTATGSFIATFVLIPITMFFMLQYRDKFKKFLELTSPERHEHTLEVSRKISRVSQMYIRGLFIDILILTVLNGIGFLLLGLKYALLLALIAAVLNIIPYVGVLIGSLIPVAVALVTKDSISYALGAFAVCSIVQFLDNNFITPKVVGSAVNLNPLASILALVAGAMIWGVIGMVLSIPLAGMFKVVCDNVEQLRPLGYMMGEEKEFKPFNFNKFKISRRKKSVEVNQD